MRKVDPVKHEEQRQRVLQAAEKRFRRDGFRGATIADICAEAQMSPGHLYHYFKSKDAIIEAMAQLHLARIESRFDEMLRKSNVVDAFCDEFDLFWKNKSLQEHQNSLLILELLAEASRNPTINKILQRRNQLIENLVADFLQKGQERGQVDPSIETNAAAAILCGVIETSRNLFLNDPVFYKVDDALHLLKRMIRQFLTPHIQK